MVNDELFRRRWLIIGLTFAIVTIFIIRLFTLQVASNDYKRRAENNAYFILSLPSPRVASSTTARDSSSWPIAPSTT